MDEIDHNWFTKSGQTICPELTCLEYETIFDELENASTRTLVSLDEARTLFASTNSSLTNDLHIKTVYKFWHERRTIRVHFLKYKLFLKAHRDLKNTENDSFMCFIVHYIIF